MEQPRGTSLAIPSFERSSTRVCVTGAAGFVASRIVSDLLQLGYQVRGTVRSLLKKDAYEHLLTLPNASTHLELVEASNENDGDFEKAFSGCRFVLHTASPFFHPTGLESPETLNEQLVKPAVSGAIQAMRAADAAGVEKVVLTSSVAAIWGSQREKNPQHVYTEEDWNDVQKIGYSFSKTQAEKAAWKFLEDHPDSKLKLVTINPSFVLGPVISRRSCESVEWLKMFFGLATVTTGMVTNVDKEAGVHSGILSFVDIRVVSRAHIEAMERETASGRYIVSNTPQQNFSQAARTLSEQFPGYGIPTHLKTGHVDKVPLSIANDHSKAERDLGLVFMDWKETLIDMTNSLISLGEIPPLSDKS